MSQAQAHPTMQSQASLSDPTLEGNHLSRRLSSDGPGAGYKLPVMGVRQRTEPSWCLQAHVRVLLNREMQTSISSLLKLPSAFVLEQAASRWLVRGSRWLNLVIGIRSNLSQWLKAGRPRLWTTLCQMYILPQPEISSRHWEPPSYGADSLPNFKQIIFFQFF